MTAFYSRQRTNQKSTNVVRFQQECSEQVRMFPLEYVAPASAGPGAADTVELFQLREPVYLLDLQLAHEGVDSGAIFSVATNEGTPKTVIAETSANAKVGALSSQTDKFAAGFMRLIPAGTKFILTYKTGTEGITASKRLVGFLQYISANPDQAAMSAA